MNLFITGAGGYIGGSVAAALLASGHQVLGLTRSPHSAAQLAARGITPVLGALDDAELLAREARQLGSLLVLGCAVAALIQTLIPRDLFLALGQAPTLSVVSLMVLALVVSVCSSVDAFLALGFADQVTPGALLAFLLLGPVIDLKSVSLLGRVFTWRAMGLVLAGVSLTVLLMGQALNLLLL